MTGACVVVVATGCFSCSSACDALDICVGIELELVEAVEEGRQKSVLKTTVLQVLSVFDSTTIWHLASLTAAPALGHTTAPEVAAYTLTMLSLVMVPEMVLVVDWVQTQYGSGQKREL